MTHKSTSPFALLSLVLTACPGAAPNSDGLDDAAATGSTTSTGTTATASGAGPTGGTTTSQGGGDLTTSGGGDPATSGGGDPTTSGGGDPTTGGSTSGGGDGGGGAGGEGGTSVASSSSSGSGGEGGYMPECDNGVVDPGELCFDAGLTHYALPRIGIPADVDGDNIIDLAATSFYFPDDALLRVCPGLGGGSFDTSNCSEQLGRSNLSWASLDGNIGLDVVGGGSGESYTGVFGLLTDDLAFDWTLLEASGFYNNVAAGDMNEDGAADLVMVRKSSRIRVFINDRAGGFTTTAFDADVNCATDRLPRIADFDEDGDLDVYVSCFEGGPSLPGPSVRVLRGDGNGNLGNPLDLRFASDRFSTETTTGDLDGDGHIDVAQGWTSLNFLNGGIELLFGRGDGTFDAPVPIVPPVPATGADVSQIVDLDADGNQDLIVTFFVSSSVSRAYLYRGEGGRNLGEPELLFPDHDTINGNASFAVTAFDLNGDGALDLLRGTPTNNWYVGQGLDVFLATP